ncbi:hypothetical protein [Clostridium acetobutylicum]|uniref:Uncharacterized protein n=1 Tax=Clostridium acetobutylicum (strain ATCC 824 / DSM 792 / JCM 1419 / IAM 19013 / LMG 5710 / NBRC 13948 / NRRL B-527 / VKM B-1787 / 2291 / W) TaxID=272562 RepID=Q97HB4_CLOAB|nr:hypothetical protein [Clostridium acetobutylicum]AAK80057.1 Hypothetical protein CA_C2098 [Clostridium acetobutylicum ATCC 824]
MKEFKEIYAVNYDCVEKTYLNMLNKITMEDIKTTDKFFDLKSRKTYVVIEGEEIYIKFFEFPKVCDNKLSYMINHELKFLYHGEKRLIFSYRKLEEKSGKVKVIVFFINTDNLRHMDKDMENKNLKAVKMIQFCFIEYYKKIIKDKNFIICFSYKKDVYTIVIKDDYIYANGVYCRKNRKLYSLKVYMENFITNNVDKKCFRSAYVVNGITDDEEIFKLLKTNFKVCRLEPISKSKLIKLIV